MMSLPLFDYPLGYYGFNIPWFFPQFEQLQKYLTETLSHYGGEC
jgi:hypothetical protein